MLWLYFLSICLTLGCLFFPVNGNPSEGPSVIFLGPGIGSSRESHTLSLPDLSNMPNNIPTYPVERSMEDRPVAAIIDKEVMVCGGWSIEDEGRSIKDEGWSDRCYTLANGSHWTTAPSMIRKRGYAAAAETKDGWWVTGGNNDTSSEIFINGKWKVGPELPKPLRGHCLLKLNSRQHLLVGGVAEITDVGENDYGDTYLLQDGDYVKVPSSKTGPTQVVTPACAMLGQDAFVVGGFNPCTQNALSTVHIWSHGRWKKGPDLPVGIYGASLVAHKDQLYLLGGRTMEPDDYSKSIYKLKQGKWKIATQLTFEGVWRWDFPALVVPQ